jgi:hydroxypyruvate reductase
MSCAFLLGLGKAAEPMLQGAAEFLPDFEAALVITKQANRPASPRVKVLEAGHPVPDARSVLAGQAALDFVRGLTERDLLVCLISGGGSALATVPRSGVSLQDLQALTSRLLVAGASVDEMNTVRRQLDALRGRLSSIARRTP